MRDLVILVILCATLLAALRHAWIGAIAWTVVSLGAPHEYFGYDARNWQVSLSVAVVTIVATLWAKGRVNPFRYPVIIVYALLMLWMTIGFPFSFSTEFSYPLYERTLKITVMLILTVALLDTRKKLEVFIWANALAIGFYGIKGGVFTITSGGSATVLGPGGFILENNGMALANAVIAPWFYYIQQRLDRRIFRLMAGASMGLVAIAALGSNSRGALLAICCMGLYFWLKTRQKVTWGLTIAGLVTLVVMLMPDSYWERMNTISTYEQDNSSLGRINAWWTAFNIANDRIFGGGFRTNINWVYEIYAPDPKLLLVEHSIYFQMLGEFGWVGLFLFLLLGAITWRNASALIRIGKSAPQLKWALDLGTVVQVSMVAYAVAGAFLSQALFDLPYNIMAIAAIGLRLARNEQAAIKSSVDVPATSPSPRAGADGPVAAAPARGWSPQPSGPRDPS